MALNIQVDAYKDGTETGVKHVFVISEADVHYWRNDSNSRFSWKVAFYCIRGYKKGNLKRKKFWYRGKFCLSQA